MPVTVLLDPAELPNRTQDQETFDNNTSNTFQKLPIAFQQINAAEAGMNSIAAGGAYAIPYTFGTGGTLGSAAGGWISVSDFANQAGTPYLLADYKDASGRSVASQLAQSGASSSTVKATARLQKVGDPSKYMILNVTSYGGTSWGALYGSVIESSSTNPFAYGDAVILYIQRTGDKGDIGSGAHVLLAQASVTSAVANIDFLNVFSAAYDKYVIEIQGAKPSVTATLGMRMANSGTVDSTSPYYQWTADGAATTTANAFNLPVSTNAGVEGSFTIEVRNANSTLAKAVGVRGFHNGTSPGGAVSREGAYVGAVVSGFRLYWSSGNFTAGTVRVYGIKNT